MERACTPCISNAQRAPEMRAVAVQLATRLNVLAGLQALQDSQFGSIGEALAFCESALAPLEALLGGSSGGTGMDTGESTHVHLTEARAENLRLNRDLDESTSQLAGVFAWAQWAEDSSSTLRGRLEAFEATVPSDALPCQESHKEFKSQGEEFNAEDHSSEAEDAFLLRGVQGAPAEKAAVEEAGAEKAATEKVAGEKAATDAKAAAEIAAAKKAAAEKADAEKATAEKAAAAKAAAEKVAVEKAAAEKIAAEQAAAEKATADKVAVEKAAAEKAAAAKVAAEKAAEAAAEKAASEKAAAEKAAAAKVAAEKEAKAATETAAAEKLVAEKAAAEKAAASVDNEQDDDGWGIARDVSAYNSGNPPPSGNEQNGNGNPYAFGF